MGIWILSSPNLYHSHSILFVWKKYSKMIYVSALSFFTMTTCIDQQQLLPPPPRLNQHHRTPHPTLLHHCAPSPTHLYIWFNNVSVRRVGNMDSWDCWACFVLIPLQEDPDTIDRLITDAEASYNKWRHPDPYIGKLTSLSTLFHIYLMPHCFLSLSIGNFNISHP